ncbi:MAG: prepilin-type N-terminal cleavage/methylation domain-containing protein [Gemmatimonadaceae bacterium]
MATRHAGQRRRAGFTMIELMVALAISGIVAAAAYAAVRFAADASTRLRDARTGALSGATARLTLEGWLRGATFVDGADRFVGLDRRGEGRPMDELTYGVADAGAHHPGPHRVRLWIDRSQSTRAQGLVAELTPIRAGVLAPPETVTLAPGAAGLRMRYRVRLLNKERWVDAWESSKELPRAIELQVIGPAGTAPAVPLSPLWLVPMVVGRGWGGE